MRRTGNTLRSPEHLWYNQRVLVPLTNWPALQYKPNLIGPLFVEGEWSVEAEARPLVRSSPDLVQAYGV